MCPGTMAQQFAYIDTGTYGEYYDRAFDNRRLTLEQLTTRPFSTVLRAVVELTTKPITTIRNVLQERKRVTDTMKTARDVTGVAVTGYAYAKDKIHDTFGSREQPDPGPEEAENRNRTMEDNPVTTTKADLNAHPDSKKAQQVAGDVRDRLLFTSLS